MLRRRIFSSAMASVMALSTVAVVAQAEETKAVKSEADLDALVNTELGTNWRTGELLDYGTSQTEKMLDALDAAEAILYDSEAKEEDWTVAWYMVKGVKESLKCYRYDDLQKLIKKAEPYFAKNNIYNEELNDNIYPVDKYNTLEEKYEYAKTFTETDLVPDITEAYVALDDAINAMYKLDTVTKSQYRAILNEYEAIIADAHKYDSWRRGSGIDVDWTKRAGTTFGYVYDTVLAAKDEITLAYDELDQIKGLSITTDTDIRAGYELAQKAIAFYKAWTPDTDTRGSKASVKNLLNKYNGQLVHDFMADDLGAKDSTTATTLIGQIGALTTINYLGDWGNLWTEVFDWTTGRTTPILYSAEANVKLDDTVYIPVDENNKWVKTCDVQAIKPVKMKDGSDEWSIDGGTSGIAGTEDVVRYLALSANSKFDLADYIKIDPAVIVAAHTDDDTKNGFFTLDNGSDDLVDWSVAWPMAAYDADADSTEVDLATALIIADAYMNGVYGDVDTDGDPATTKDDIANAAFDEYIDGAGDGMLETIIGVAADTKGLTVNLEGAILDDDDSTTEVSATNRADIAAANDIIDVIDETGVVAYVAGETAGRAKGQATEWTVVYRYLNYALQDNYAGTAPTDGSKYTWADVNALVAKAEKLVDDTGDAAIFNPSNVALVEARQDAREWCARAKSDKLYRDGVAGTGADGYAYEDSDTYYKAFEPVYKALADEYAALSMSFEEVYAKIADTAKAIDNGDIDDSADLQNAIMKVAECLSNIDDITYYGATPDQYTDNAAFDMSREFLGVNRVVTGKAVVEAIGGEVSLDANPTHKALGEALAALDAAIEKATEPEVVVVAGDYDGNGSLELDDAIAIIDAVLENGGVAIADTKGDMDGDGDTDLEDAIAIIDAKFAELLG